MGIHFGLVKNKKKKSDPMIYLSFREEIEQFLDENHQYFSVDITPLLCIDPYRDTVFGEEDVRLLFQVCEGIMKEIEQERFAKILSNYLENHKLRRKSLKQEDIKEFALLLRYLCKIALEENMLLIAIGD